ncbi:hypothetical protein POTOM_011133 [Populus tomentosa]|uniref:Uncharacterized protein n=1 Tax=Populus tomentosa TaxID=118781 RepID=A0A8X8AJ42_POPTO|nr:hypothetical protein POTOM_011133 [Populus tomentosa]
MTKTRNRLRNFLSHLLREAANGHKNFTDKIRQVAGQDPVRRKIFVHGLGWDTNAEALMNAFKPVIDPLHKHSSQFWSTRRGRVMWEQIWIRKS